MKATSITFLIIIITLSKSLAQNIKMELYVIPFWYDFSKAISCDEVVENSTLKIIASDEISSSSFETMCTLLKNRNIQSVSDTVLGLDFRVCIVIYCENDKYILYFNYCGNFTLEGKGYKNDFIKSFIFSFIPEFAKER